MKQIKSFKINPNPIHQFEKWYAEARKANEPFFDAMTLATASRRGKPSARQVLLKEVSKGGFVFFTNYQSKKAKELLENPVAALVFYWPSLYRQVRIEGRVQKISEVESDQYWRTRPRSSQISGTASRQSHPIKSRTELQQRVRALAEKFYSKEIPRPSFWGGFRVIPTQIEFWFGQEDRLHHRVLYKRPSVRSKTWKTVILAP